MKAYEYEGKVLPDGHLSIPEDLRSKLKSDSKIRVMLLVDYYLPPNDSPD